MKSASRPPRALGWWEVRSMDTGREYGTAVEEARMTRFVGFMVERI